MYRIYTEDLNRGEVLRLAAEKFENFTLQSTTGYIRGEAEDSIVIEIVQAQEQDVAELANGIRRLNGQRSGNAHRESRRRGAKSRTVTRMAAKSRLR